MLTEDYRPETVDGIVGQDHVKPKLKEYLRRGEIPNLLFAGDPGLGKTTAAIAIARELYGDEWRDFFKELNASDDRGIDVVRDQIKEFAKSGWKEGDRLIFLDEADSLTSEAQAALRRTMEKHSSTCKYILSCNYSGQIIDAIQSRCAVFRFKAVPDDQLKEHLQRIAEAEDMDIEEAAIDDIIRYAGGDVRKAVTAVDALYIGETLTSEEVVKVLPIADQDDVVRLLNLCSVGQFNQALDFADELIKKKGVTTRNIINEIHNVVWDTSLDDRHKVNILEMAGQTDFAVTEGATEQVQMAALLGRIVKETN